MKQLMIFLNLSILIHLLVDRKGEKMKDINNVTIKNVKRLMFRNFAGAKSDYNALGNRNFCIPLDIEMAEKMVVDGWNVKQSPLRNPNDFPQPFVQVTVNFKYYPPSIVLINSRGRRTLSENNVALLDDINIKKVDIVIRPYSWEVRGERGIKAYLKTLYVTIAEDEFADDYRDVPELGDDSSTDEHAY